MGTPEQMKIEGFYGPYRYLSNFYIEPDGTHVEGEYQVCKCAEESDVRRFVGLSPKQAKSMGSRVRLRLDWDDVRVSIMWELVAKKFTDHPQLAQLLMNTQKSYLEETNWWGDQFWGVSGGDGLNFLGHILMDVRGSLQSGSIRRERMPIR